MLARWSSWGAVPDVFDDTKSEWENERSELRGLLDDVEWDAAARTTINAHYTEPLIAAQMWRAIGTLGFTGGEVLEPGSGSGAFIGLAPDAAQVTGVELDPLTAAISRGLYPHAEVRAESFADTRLPEGVFDAAIGNVPFGNVTLHDPVHNPTRQSMHNHFILKSLRLTRLGGLVAVLTSHYTMDAQNPGARREMNALADLVGAVRLPTGAHRRAAGTEVITDLLIFRRRAAGEPARDDLWETVTPITIDGQRVKINAYFDHHPERVLGDIGVGHGMYGNETLTVNGNLDRLESDFADVIDQITFTARRNELEMTPRTAAQESRRAAFVPSPPELWDGSIVAADDGGFRAVVAGAVEPLVVPKSAAVEVRALLGLRDAATRLLNLEAATVDDTDEITAARADLKRGYQKYVGTYGPLNRYTLRRTGRTNDAGEDIHARVVPTPIRLLRGDPFGPLVLALEQFDDTDQTATTAAVISRRVVAPRAEVQGVETPADAIAVSLDKTGGIDLGLIADMLGMPEAEARAALDGLVFTDPATDDLVHAPAYLSGDVRTKLEAATARAADDAAFRANVDALADVLPDVLGLEDITARMGAVWIGPETHERFLNELLRTTEVRVENPLPGMWEVRGGRQGLLATSEWGTERRPAPDIAQAVMEQRTLLVHDEIEDADGRKRQVLNPVETTAAQEKADALQERFAEWVWEDPERAKSLVDEYNRRFNSIVLRDYTDAGEYLTLPGLAANFTPRPHQRAAVARMIAEPAAGLFHDVGAGKTAEMIMGAMEMRRMGLITKPVLVVPNHMLEQFGREWLQIYPRARILAASSHDLTTDKRRLFVARASANEWDAIILTQGAFAKIPLRAETQTAYVQAEVERVKKVLEDAKGEDRMSVKRIQRRLLQSEMLKMWSIFADVKTADDLQLPTPDLAVRDDGKRAPTTVAVQPTVELERFIEHLGQRAEKVAAKAVSPDEDNMLNISTDGRKAALDIRMIAPDAPSGPTKVDVAADTIYRVWEQTKDNEYLDVITGQPSPARGALQLVFSDIGTPNPQKWNAYDELHLQLVERGMPTGAIRYMHEAKTDADKARLFAAARAGHIAVLMGSTEKMGVGTNVQARAVALYHLDCPWRPSDIAQREGRILRQGNQNAEVAIGRFVTERSFDSYMWQGVERKATFIAQLMRGRLDTREIEEIESSALSAAEAKAISSGNPLLLEHSTIQNEVTRLRRLERAYHRNESMLVHTRDRARTDAHTATQDIAALEAALPRVSDTSGDRFSIDIDGRGYRSRVDAGQALTGWAHRTDLKWASRHTNRDHGVIGRISGFDVHLAARPALGDDLMIEISLADVPRSSLTLTRATFLDGGTGLVQRIENRVSGIPTLLDHAHSDLADAEHAISEAEQRIGQPFRHAAALTKAEADLARVETQLAALQEDNDPQTPEVEPAPTGATQTGAELSVEAVRAHRPALGVRADPGRQPADTSTPRPDTPSTRPGPTREL